jgi:U32 family peptidase
MRFKAPEVLAPAGNLEKMKTAFAFGADAVYFGIPNFSLRVRINQFDEKEILKAAEFCKKNNKKFYLTLNIYAHNRHIEELSKYLEFIAKISPDALIVSDPGILRIIKEQLPKMPIHLSTQANVTNASAVKFWQEQGVERIILAREVTLEEIRQIKKEVPEMELEYFVHGAMCMSYSGRCILSKWMTNRSANLGDCSQPCRWKYKNTSKEMEIVDDKERFKMKVEEDEHGTYLFNSYDMCLVEHVGELIEAGIDSLKIEGRAKSVFYVGVVTRAYRKVVDAFGEGVKEYQKAIREEKAELLKLANRGYGKGFLLGGEPDHSFSSPAIAASWEFVGSSDDFDESKNRKVFVHNKLGIGDDIEIITPKKIVGVKILKITNKKGEEIVAAHGGQNEFFEIKFNKNIKGPFLLRARM